MRLGGLLLMLGGSLLTAARAAATPPPLRLHDAEGRPLSLSAIPRAPTRSSPAFELGGPSRLHETIAATNTRITKVVHDVTLDPATGELTGTSDVTLRAEVGTVWALTMYLDDGLHVSAVSAPGRTISTTDEVLESFRYSYLDIAPEIAAGQELTLQIRYAGRLNCKPTNPRYCRLSSLSYL